jgi:hypothetical protein
VSTISIRRRVGVALATTALAGAAATAVAPPATAGTAPIRANDNLVRIVAHDNGSHMSFTITGTPRAGRVAMRFVNRGRYAHEMTLLRLKKHATLAQFKKAMQQPDFEKAAGKLLVNPSGEIAGPAQLGPGLSETVYAPLRAGRYVVVCFLPGPGGMPHARMGMVAGLWVHATARKVAAPRTDGTVRITNHKIVLPKNFKRGGTFKVTNTGTRPHSLSLVKLKGKATLSQMFGCVGQAFATSTMIDKCPGTLAGGVSELAPGHTAYLRISLARGHYGYVSSDGNDFAKGLKGTFTVH